MNATALFTNVLVPIDGSPPSDRALDEALRIAQRSDGRVRALHVVDTMAISMAISAGGMLPVEVVSAIEAAGEVILQHARDRAARQGVTIDTKLHQAMDGRLCDIVHDEANEWHADLIVVGSHGRKGMRRLALGSDAEEILRYAEVPVLVVRQSTAAQPTPTTRLDVVRPAAA